MDDEIPELEETFSVRLVSSSGDTVLFTNYTTHVYIKENDYPYGLYQFNSTDVVMVDEGDPVTLR